MTGNEAVKTQEGNRNDGQGLLGQGYAGTSNTHGTQESGENQGPMRQQANPAAMPIPGSMMAAMGQPNNFMFHPP